ncbi:hypothetical protein [Egbenema bharatensis]|uniref:hypothetical protein n=1 Tax=Egbenema bharatensis TaxID=3463334 RepID=UPI003A8B6B73
MTYTTRLYPWIIVHQLPNMQHSVVKRFRRRNDADECLKALYRLEPGKKFVVMFDTAGCAKEVQQ